MKYGLRLVAVMLCLAAPGYAKPSIGGTYLCTVAEKAGIGSIHLEGSGAPSAFVRDGPPTRFKIQIKPVRKGSKQYRLGEIVYDGPDRDGLQLEDDNSVLHSQYLGDGEVFNAIGSPGFWTFRERRSSSSDGNFVFYHAGFEHPGGEDTNLAVRWGRCRKVV